MLAKERKTLYLPEWIIKMLDSEGNAYKGPGLAASVAIWHFCNQSETAKKRIYAAYSKSEIKSEYGCAGAIDAGPTVKAQRDGKEDADRAARKVLPGGVAQVENVSIRKAKCGKQAKSS